MAQFRDLYKKFKDNGKGKQSLVYRIFDEFGFTNCKIELVELYPCKTIEELKDRENRYIRSQPCINTSVEPPDGEARRKSNLEYAKKYYVEHKDEIKQRKEKYRVENEDTISAHNSEQIKCPYCGSTTNRASLRKHKFRSKCTYSKLIGRT